MASSWRSTTIPVAAPMCSPSSAPIAPLYYNMVNNCGSFPWSSPSFGDLGGRDKIYGMDIFYANIQTEYTSSNIQVSTNAISYRGYVIDTTNSAAGKPSTGTILGRVPTPPLPATTNVVYTEIPRGNAGYCGWHSYSYCGSKLVQIAFIFNLDNDPGCGAATSTSSIPVNAG
jgi:hypothetical protein